MMKMLRMWHTRLTDPEERRNYFAAEGQKLAFACVYAVINLIVFFDAVASAFAFFVPSIVYAQQYQHSWIPLARGFGNLLNLNCAAIVLPTMRTLLSKIRHTWIGRLLPIDKNIIFHRFCAYMIVFSTVGHAASHYFNYACCYPVYVAKSAYEAAWINPYGATGHLLVIVMVFMFAAAHQDYRRSKNFTVFWYSHHMFILFFALMLFHGRNFWKWFLGPGLLYIVERILRVYRGAQPTNVKRVHHLPSGVLHLELEKPNFVYKAGQYCFLNCPSLSAHEWHPFTISSAPEEETVSFHIRCVGDWTRSLSELVNPNKQKDLVVDQWIGPDGKTPIIRLDGPFGAPAEDVFNYEHIMLIAAGIGVTPYSSILKHIRNRVAAGTAGKLRKVYFYWINRDEGSWEWFADILAKLETEARGFIEIHTFFTGELKVDDIRLIIFNSSEYNQRRKTLQVSMNSRALYDYEPQSADEVELKENDNVMVLEKDASGWWKGKNERTGETGLFPASYVMTLDNITSLENNSNRHFGRPQWDLNFREVRLEVERLNPTGTPKVGVFFCGPAVLSKELYKFSIIESRAGRTQFDFKKENF